MFTLRINEFRLLKDKVKSVNVFLKLVGCHHFFTFHRYTVNSVQRYEKIYSYTYEKNR